MVQKSVITDEMRASIGAVGPSSTIKIEERMVKRFVDATEDPNPLWQKMMPPSLLFSVMMSGGETRPKVPTPFARVVDGGLECEFLNPVKIGDVITTTIKLVDIRERQGRDAVLVFYVFDSTHTNQKGEVVAKTRGTAIYY